MIDSNPEIGFEDIVRHRAYALWESEGRPCGRDAEHWRISEDRTRAELTGPSPKKAARKAASPEKLGKKLGKKLGAAPKRAAAAIEIRASH